MTKKITFILGSLRHGGAERVISVIANHYIKKLWHVDIILLLSSETEYKLNSKINIISFAEDNTEDNFIKRLRQLPRWIFRIRRYTKENKPDVILSFVARINIITAIANTGLKNKLVVSERNDPSKDGRSKLVKYMTSFFYTKVTKVVFQTKQAQACFSENVKKNSVVIYNPVIDMSEFERPNIIKKRIITVGRLELQKNQELLIESFKEIHKSNPEYELFIYGEGALRDKLQKKIDKLDLSEFVYLPGTTNNIHNKMAESEIFVLSSDYEGMSNALLEAMTIGLPVVSTQCAGSTEIIEDMKNGLLVPIQDANEMTRAIEYLIENQEYAKKLGEAAQEKSEVFNGRKVLHEWEKILEDS